MFAFQFQFLIILGLGYICRFTVAAIPTTCLLQESITECIKEQERRKGMKLFLLKDNSVTCNDGTRPGYYVRKNPLSSKWIVYLEGGLFCHDKNSCALRMTQKLLTSSKLLQEKKLGNGLLSLDKQKNPEFYQYNHVYIPYCSSDFWIGKSIFIDENGSKIAFHGSKILKGVVKELLGHGLRNAVKVVIAGSSAGGIGVLHNIDRISTFLSKKVKTSSLDVRGIVDSAWFLQIRQDVKCKGKFCGPEEMFKASVKLWNAEIHAPCLKKMKNEKHKCLFAPYITPLLKTPIFFFQWLLDTVQIFGDNAEMKTRPSLIFSSKYRPYINRLSQKMKLSLKSIGRKHGIYAPSCFSHTALAMTASVGSVTLKNKTFTQTLRCWLTDKKLTKCRRRLIDTCTGWNCHSSCPKISHPLTGQVLNPPQAEQFPSDEAKHYLELLNKLFSWKSGRTDSEKQN